MEATNNQSILESKSTMEDDKSVSSFVDQKNRSMNDITPEGLLTPNCNKSNIKPASYKSFETIDGNNLDYGDSSYFKKKQYLKDCIPVSHNKAPVVVNKHINIGAAGKLTAQVNHQMFNLQPKSLQTTQTPTNRMVVSPTKHINIESNKQQVIIGNTCKPVQDAMTYVTNYSARDGSTSSGVVNNV